MSAGYLGKINASPNETSSTIARSETERLYGSVAGEIVSFDSEKQTAEIKVLYMPRHNGGFVQIPNLLDVPVRFDRTAKGGLTYPVSAGDRVELRPQMRSTDRYHTTGEYTASDTRIMSLSDMEAYIDGGESLTNPIENFDAENLHQRFNDDGSFGMRASSEGKINFDLATGELMDALARVCEALAANQTIVAAGSSSGIHQHSQQSTFQDLAQQIRGMVL